MFEDILRYAKLLPLFAGMAAILGTLYNFSVVAGFGADLFYTLSYSDHVNSAILAFGVLSLVSLVLELVTVLVFKRSSFFALEMPTKWLFLVFVGLLGAEFLLVLIGHWDITNLRGGLAYLLPLFSIVFLRQAITHNDFMAFSLSFITMSSLSVWTGFDWVYETKLRSATYLITTNNTTIVAKGVKPFKDFSFVIDDEGKQLFIKTGEIQKIAKR